MSGGYNEPFFRTLRGDETIEEEIAKSMVPPSRGFIKAAIAKAAHAIVRRLSSHTLPRELFRKGLSKWLPPPGDPLAYKKVLTDGVFRDISSLLVEYGKPNWSLRPRTFAVLWMLGVPEGTIEKFMVDGRTDHYLPYQDG